MTPLVIFLTQAVNSINMGESVVVVCICLACCAFFSGIEIAFISANKLRIELKSKQGNYAAKILAKYSKKPSEFISTVLVANNLALVIYGMYMNDILQNMLEFWHSGNLIKFFAITIISTFVVLITAEYIPKSLFRLSPDSLLFSLIIPFRIAHIVLWPIIYFVKKVSSFLLRVFTKTQITENTPVFTKVDLDNYMANVENVEDEHTEVDTEVFRNALEFRETRVRDIMVPRTEIVAMDINCSIDEIKKQFFKTSLSKILIYRENIDNIIGFIHQIELFQNPTDVLKIIKPVHMTNEAVQAHDLFKEFVQKRKSIAVVIDEYGGTSGLVTVEDIVEEIFGEIEDEFDTPELTETKVKDNQYIFSARHEVYYLNEKYNLQIPEGDYTTLGGYVLHIAEKIPRVKEVIRTNKFEFIITKAKGAKIEEMELVILGD